MDNKHIDAAEILGDLDDLNLENLFNSTEENDEIGIFLPLSIILSTTYLHS